MKLVAKILALWDRFWFAPTSPGPVCLFRILFAMLAFWQALLLAPDLLTWYGRDGVLSLETARHLQDGPTLSILLWWDLPDGAVVALLVVQLVASLSLLVGYRTRLSTVLVYLTLQAFAGRNPLMFRGVDSLLRVYGFLLLFAPAGAMWSLDAFFKKKRGSSGMYRPLCAPWAQRLMQIQVTLGYWQSFWGKVGGKTWWDGTAVYYVTHIQDSLRHSVPGPIDHLWAYQIVTWFSLWIEVFMWSLIWVKGVRYWVLLVATLFHLSIHWTMNVDLTELAIVASYVNFLFPADLERFSSAVESRWRRLLRNSSRSKAQRL